MVETGKSSWFTRGQGGGHILLEGGGIDTVQYPAFTRCTIKKMTVMGSSFDLFLGVIWILSKRCLVDSTRLVTKKWRNPYLQVFKTLYMEMINLALATVKKDKSRAQLLNLGKHLVGSVRNLPKKAQSMGKGKRRSRIWKTSMTEITLCSREGHYIL